MRKSYARFFEREVLSVTPLRRFAFRAARFAVLCCLVSLAAPLFAATYYASPTGTNSAAGTEADPYDIATACSKLGNNTYDEVKLFPGTYKVGSVTLASIDYRAKMSGVGAKASDAVLDFEGAGSGLTVSHGSSLHNVTISNFVNCTGLTTANNTGYGDAVISNCVICCGTCSNKPATSITGNGGPVLVVDSVIRNVTSSYTYGCACYCANPNLHLLRTTISDNESSSWSAAAALYSNQSGVLVENCVISNNVATQRHGGAIYTESVGIRLKDTLFYGNRAAGGSGGAFFAQSSTTTTNVIEGCTFIANSCSGSSAGGAINAQFYNTLVSNCTFIANVAGSQGGAISCYSSDAVKVANLRVVGCAFTNNTAVGGAAISLARRGAAMLEFPFEISGCHFNGNTNKSNSCGGAILIPGFAQVNVTDCDFEGNFAGTGGNGEGGAIGRTNDAYNEAMARAVCRRCRFTNNRAAVGAAISATASLYDCDFFGNIATNSTASGCDAIVYLHGKRLVAKEYLDESFTNFVSGCRFEGNVVYGTTMGIMAPFGDFRCYDTTFSNNVGYTSHTTGGWSVNLRAPTYFEVDRCQFVGNTTASPGSGFHCEKGTTNDSMTNGWVRNSLFYKNYSVTSLGASCGVIHLSWTNTWISGCSIVSNYIYGGIWAAVNTSCIQSNCIANCILYMNDSNSGAQYLDVDGSANKQPYFHNCFITNGKFTDNGCLGKDQDPGFVDIANGNLQLHKNSVCVNAGDNEPWMIAATDVRGNRKFQRIENNIVDIGCYEYRPQSAFLLMFK